jgi:uncharacterized protein YraI
MNQHRIRPGRAFRIAGAALGGAVVALLVFVGPAAAATGTVHTTSGASLTVRSGPHTTSTAVGSVADGASITFDCQIHGDSVVGVYGPTDLWDHISTGYVSDAYVYTGSDGTVAPLCGGSSTPTCSTSGLGDPNTCAQAVSWAKSHETTTYHADYYNLCDHVAGLAYGFPASGSTTAYGTGRRYRPRTGTSATRTYRPAASPSSPAEPAT